MSAEQPTIIYTLTDEAPMLATAAFLPLVRSFAAQAGIDVVPPLRHLGGSAHPRRIPGIPHREAKAAEQSGRARPAHAAARCQHHQIAQHQRLRRAAGRAIKELQAKGYKIPDYPEAPKTEDEKAIRARYAKCIGSSVNPVLREGNSDRRAPPPSRNMPARTRTRWPSGAKRRARMCRHMHHGDFYAGEKSLTLDKARDVKMELLTKSGKTIVLKPKVALLDKEVIDSMFMSKKALLEFYEKEIEDARKTGVMFSLHVKATMMKVSHPIVFGHCVKIFYKDAFAKHGKLFEELGVNVNNGMVNLDDRIVKKPPAKQAGRNQATISMQACQQ